MRENNSYDERLKALGYQPKQKKNSFYELFRVYKSDCFNLKRVKETIFAYCLSFQVRKFKKLGHFSKINLKNVLVSDMERYSLRFLCWNYFWNALVIDCTTN